MTTKALADILCLVICFQSMAYPMKKTRHAKIPCLDDDHTDLFRTNKANNFNSERQQDFAM